MRHLVTVIALHGAIATGCIPKTEAGAGAPRAQSGQATPAGPATRPGPSDSVAEPPVAPPTGGVNPFAGKVLYVDGNSQAHHAWVAMAGPKKRLLKLIADQPQADWLGEWSGMIESDARGKVRASSTRGQLRTFVVYNLPNRDCGSYSAGGVGSAESYRAWISALARGIGDAPISLVLEPDSLGQLEDCLSEEDQAERVELIRFAVRTFRMNPNAAVYVDAGHPNWLPAEEAARRLTLAGVSEAHGFSLNVSNYVDTPTCIAYGKQVLAKLGGGLGFVVDTSRNGKGAPPDGAWCNPPGRGLGHAPTVDTGDPDVHALLWIKRPGESDGTCNGGPEAGKWWGEMAVELARGAALE